MKMRERKSARTRRRSFGRGWAAAVIVLALASGLLGGCSANDNASSDSGNYDRAASTAKASAGSSAQNATMDDTADTNRTTATEASASSDAKTSDSDKNSASTAAAVGGTGFDGSDAAGEGQEVDRKIVYKGNVTMEVASYAKAEQALRNLIHLSDGYLLKFADEKTSTEIGGTFTVKVPASGFDSFLAGIERIEHLDYQKSAQGTDVTEEYVDMQARLKAREVVEARLLDFMSKATKTADLLQISTQLGDVQTEIERIKGRIRYLDNNVAYSTIDLRLYEPTEAVQAKVAEKRGFGGRITAAFKDSASFIGDFFQGLIVVAAGALPVIVVVALIGIPTYLFARNARRKRIAGNQATAGSQSPALPASNSTITASEGKSDHPANTGASPNSDTNTDSNRGTKTESSNKPSAD